MSQERGNILLGVLIGLLIAGGLFGGYYFINHRSSVSSVPPVAVQTPQPTVTSQTPAPTTDPTANWKTYTNQKFSFSLKYPANWELTEDGRGQVVVYLTEPKDQAKQKDPLYQEGGPGPEGCITVEHLNFNGSVADLLQQFTDGQLEGRYTKQGDTIVDGHPAVITLGGCCADSGKQIYISHNNSIYVIMLHGYIDSQDLSKLNPPGVMINNDIFNTIVSTFKFLN